MNSERNIVVVLSGPSGVGKGTVAKKIVELNKNVALSISAVTRSPRVGEVDGREYFFIEKETFQKEIENGGFLEYSEHFGNFYGTPKQFVLDKLKTKDVLLEIDVNGGLSVKKNFQEAVLIMIVPPSLEELKRRLVTRNTETEEQIALRLQRTAFEIAKKEQYDYTVVNDDLDTCVNEILEIIKKEKLK